MLPLQCCQLPAKVYWGKKKKKEEKLNKRQGIIMELESSALSSLPTVINA